jgi:hypothetical protein
MRCGWRVSAVVLIAIALTVGADRAYCAADYAREARLAQEIVPAIVVGDAVYLATARQPRVLALYTDAASPAIAKAAIIVVHGVGVHPDWALINGLRTGLAEAGMSTLSVQMPVLSADAPREQYATLFPDSNERLAAAVAYLRERGAERIAIVSHSIGGVDGRRVSFVFIGGEIGSLGADRYDEGVRLAAGYAGARCHRRARFSAGAGYRAKARGNAPARRLLETGAHRRNRSLHG